MIPARFCANPQEIVCFTSNFSSARSSVAMVNITVSSGNLYPPRFAQTVYRAVVNEASAVGTIVTQVQVERLSLFFDQDGYIRTVTKANRTEITSRKRMWGDESCAPVENTVWLDDLSYQSFDLHLNLWKFDAPSLSIHGSV